MISKLFKKDSTLMVTVRNHSDVDSILININADSTLSERKSKLHISKELKERIGKDVLQLWKGLPPAKKEALELSFYGVDWYDDTDDYLVPNFSIGKGKRSASIGCNHHDYTPKEWGVEVYVRIKSTSRYTPILDVICKTLDIDMKHPLIVRLHKQIKENLKQYGRATVYNND